MLIRASSIEADRWCVKALHEFINFSALMEEASARYDAVSKARPHGLILDNDAFAKWSAKTKWAKSFYDTKLRSREMGNLDPSRPGPGSKSNDTALGDGRPCLMSPTQDLGLNVDLPMLPEIFTGTVLDPVSAFDDPI